MTDAKHPVILKSVGRYNNKTVRHTKDNSRILPKRACLIQKTDCLICLEMTWLFRRMRMLKECTVKLMRLGKRRRVALHVAVWNNNTSGGSERYALLWVLQNLILIYKKVGF